MNRHKVLWVGFTIAVLATLSALPQTIQAGPPLICHPFDIGNAKSLPWGSNLWSFSGKEDYDLKRLVEDTLNLLSPDAPIIVRMETLRRAALYALKDPQVGKELVERVKARALAAEAKGRSDPPAWFDAGYLVETYKQAGVTFKKLPSGSYEPVFKPNPASEFDGLAWVQKAIHLRGQDPEMEFAAALITVFPRQKSHEEHLRKAVAGATDGSLLAKNLVTHFGQHGSTIAELRAQVGIAKN